MSPFLWLLNLLIDIALVVILAQVVLSWLIGFNIVDPRRPIVASVWDGIQRMTEPVYRPIRRVLPDLGGIDLSPMVLIVGLLFLERLATYYLR